eukprot:scaffold160081_cov27-Tisochrysis_lutea.AAC.1
MQRHYEGEDCGSCSAALKFINFRLAGGNCGTVLSFSLACTCNLPATNSRRVSLVGVAAEVHVCRRMTQETGGSYGIALNETHLSARNLHIPHQAHKIVDAYCQEQGYDMGETEFLNSSEWIEAKELQLHVHQVQHICSCLKTPSSVLITLLLHKPGYMEHATNMPRAAHRALGDSISELQMARHSLLIFILQPRLPSIPSNHAGNVDDGFVVGSDGRECRLCGGLCVCVH